MEFGKRLEATTTPIPGLLVFELPVFGDNRGWFKENWQRTKMVDVGLPDFGPVQNNVSFNDAPGTTRGIHAEPWDKFVSVSTGRIFGAWVDLRAGDTFGTVFTIEIDPTRAVYVPRGVGNAYQTLEADTAYTYLVNDHWSPDASYTFLNLADEASAIEWPISLESAEISTKDRAHPRLDEVTPIPEKRVLVIGAGGQLGRALRTAVGDDGRFEFAERADLDLLSPGWETKRDWRQYDTIINAAAFTAVDRAETPDGRRDAWAVNVHAVARLARLAQEHRICVVQVSSDYVFDGNADGPYAEDSAFCPLGVYGQTKAAGDAVIAMLPRHYVIRTSWVIGDGANFVRTMVRLAESGVDPAVVDDQLGRLTFADDLARGILHLLDSGAGFGTYNLTSDGPVQSWADIAREVFALCGHDPARVSGVSTSEYFASATGPVAPRPAFSGLDLTKIVATGFVPTHSGTALAAYLASSP